ncbi:hypothetical protein KI387_000567, partial [Taxus chinensis]
NEAFILRSDLKDFRKRLNGGDPANKTAFNRLQRWGLWFDNFEFSVEHISGKQNALADFVSRELNTPKNISVTQ